MYINPISKRVGKGGDIPNVAIEWVEQIGHTNFNPFRDIFAGGTLLGFNGKNYFIRDKTFLIGWIFRKIFEN